MKRFLQTFFMVLGIIFFILILGGAYLYVADPFNIKPLLKILTAATAPAAPANTPEAPGASVEVKKSTTFPAPTKNPLLTPTQEQALEKAGINPAALPTQITPAMAQCFYEKLGAHRANEIKAGAAPSLADYVAARSCL